MKFQKEAEIWIADSKKETFETEEQKVAKRIAIMKENWAHDMNGMAIQKEYIEKQQEKLRKDKRIFFKDKKQF